MTAHRHVALLRGINVGKAKRISMADLKVLYESLGLTEVRTLLNSGNVVFTAPGKTPKNLANVLEEATTEKLGVSSRVTLVSAAELAAIVAGNPFTKIATDPSRLVVSILANVSDRPKIAVLVQEHSARETFAFGTGEAARVSYLWCPEGILKSKLAELLHGKHKEWVTNRNWATISKLNALVQESAKP